jgi:hypothetical protein
MPYCLSLACNNIDFFLQIEVVLFRKLLDGVGGEFSKLHGKKLFNCDKLECSNSTHLDIDHGDLFWGCLVRSDEVHDAI